VQKGNTSIKRIIVLGTSGSGKTSLAKELSSLSGYPSTDLDDLFWLPNWTPRGEEEVLGLIKEVAEQECWIISGNYTISNHLTWPKADILIWLDYPLPTLVWRALKRSFRRIVKREACCNGNYETIGKLFSRNSILAWIFSSYYRRKKRFNKILNEPGEYRQKMVRVSNKNERMQVLNSIWNRLPESRDTG